MSNDPILDEDEFEIVRSIAQLIRTGVRIDCYLETGSRLDVLLLLSTRLASRDRIVVIKRPDSEAARVTLEMPLAEI